METYVSCAHFDICGYFVVNSLQLILCVIAMNKKKKKKKKSSKNNKYKL